MEHNILVVDDDPGMIRLMARILAGLGQFRFATHGEAAIQLVRDWQPDLLILDAEMPGMSGFQVCEDIKSDPTLCDVPIIFVTCHSDHDFEVKGLEIGAADFIAKPVNEALVLARVKTQLRLKRLTDDLRRSATKDVLTKLPNRLSFEETLGKEWPRAVSSGREIGMLVFELDHFEAYVERYGHGAADQTVRKVAQVLRRTSKHPAHALARLYRNTFAILMPETSQEEAERMAWEAINGIEKLGIEHATSTTSIHVTASVGLSVYDRACSGWAEPDQGGQPRQDNPYCDGTDLRNCAFEALAKAKRNGGGQAWWMDMGRDLAKLRAQEILPALGAHEMQAVA